MLSISHRIYHERQYRQLCALHTLNNLYQQPNKFTVELLNQYCYALTPREWLNPHRSWFGWGNYDINVLMHAVGQHNGEIIWFDKRKSPICLNLPEIFGFIMNVPAPWRMGPLALPIQMRHWLALRSIEGNYYNLDSKLTEPICIGGDSDFIEFLHTELASGDRELFIVITTRGSNNNDERLWLKPRYRRIY